MKKIEKISGGATGPQSFVHKVFLVKIFEH